MCQELSKMTELEVRRFFHSFDTVMTDCDGVLWKGAAPIPGSPEMICKFRQLGKKVIYVSNNSTDSRKVFMKKFNDLGFGGDFEDIYNPAFLVAKYLTNLSFDKKVYIFGSQGIADELNDVGIENFGVGPDPFPMNWSLDAAVKIAAELDQAVHCVVASSDFHLSFIKLMKAINYLSDPEVIFLATNTDETLPFLDKGLIPDTGAIVAAVSTCAERQPIILGKPYPYVFDTLKLQHPHVQPERTLMIGDKCSTDILFGRHCGLQTLLVGTGVSSLHDVRSWQQQEGDPQHQQLVPDFYVDRLADLLPMADRLLEG